MENFIDQGADVKTDYPFASALCWKIRVAPDHPITNELPHKACRAEKADLLIELLKQGFNPADQKDHGSSLIQTCIQYLPWSFDYDWFIRDKNKDIDSSRSREIRCQMDSC